MDGSESLDIVVKTCKEAIHSVFTTMCPMELGKCDISVGDGMEKLKDPYQMIGVVSLTGQCKGSVSVHVPRELSEAVTKKMLGLDTVENESDTYDVVGELGNLVAGCSKTLSSSQGLDFDISCPTVIKGHPNAIVEPPKGARFGIILQEIQGLKMLVLMYLVN